jgi:phage shock protein C
VFPDCASPGLAFTVASSPKKEGEPMTTETTSASLRRLYRSRDERMVAGVCGGIAQYTGMDPTIVRLLAVLSFLLPGPQLLAYLLAWIVIPEQPA